MKIETKITLKSLEGKELKTEAGNLTLGEALSNILISSEVGGKMKLFTLAQKMYNDKSVEVDASDLSMIKECVKTTKIYNALVAGQVELILEDIK